MNKMMTRFLSVLLVFLLSLFIFGCTGEITDPTTTSDLSTTSTTSTATTTTTTATTTTTTTTTSPQTTQSVATTTQTQIPTDDIIYEDIDELFLSINRLTNADFTINTDFVENTSTQQVHYLPSESFRYNLLFSNYSLIGMNTGISEFNPDDYIQDETRDYMFYHKSLFDTPELVGGMYRLTSFLDGYTLFNREQFISDLSGIAQRSQDKVFWAIDNIRVMDTWIEYSDPSGATMKYLLEYDPINDTVSLYVHEKMIAMESEDYQKISVFYNDLGEEVIETYIYYELDAAFENGVKKSLTFYNSVNHRDYNLAIAEFDVDGNPVLDNLNLRGVNLGEDGKYRMYENSSYDIRNYTKGDFGWYMYGNVGIDDLTNEVTVNEYETYYSFFSQDMKNSIFDMMRYEDCYWVSINLSAFEGYNALLFQEGCLNQRIIVPISSPVNYFNTDGYTSGLETSNGSYYTTDPLWDNSIQLDNVVAIVGKESTQMTNQYYNYFGALQLKIYANSTSEAMTSLEGYLNHIGLTYRFGDLHEFLTEMTVFHDTSSDNLSTFTFLNDVLGFDEYPYSSAQSYQAALEHLFDYMDISEEINDLVTSKEVLFWSDQPDNLDLSSIALVDISNIYDSSIPFDETTYSMDTSSLSITVPRSPLFQPGLEYSLIYSYQVGGVLYPFYISESQTYSGLEMTFDSLTPIALIGNTNLNRETAYQVVVYIGRIQGDSIWRISEIVPVIVDEFDPINLIQEVEGIEYTFEITYSDGSIWITKK